MCLPEKNTISNLISIQVCQLKVSDKITQPDVSFYWIVFPVFVLIFLENGSTDFHFVLQLATGNFLFVTITQGNSF